MTFKDDFLKPGETILDQLLPEPIAFHNFHGYYDIMTDHSAYDENALMMTMPNDIARVAIVREPMAQLHSSFKFHHLYDQLNLTENLNSIVKFIQNPQFYVDKYKSEALWATQNRVAGQFGYNDSSMDISEYMQNIHSKFLVLVLELLDESLVILKRKLCWTLNDVLYIPLLRSEYDHEHILTNTSVVEEFKKWNPYDFMFYDFFKTRMEEEIAEQGLDLQLEVEYFKTVRNKVARFCSSICETVGRGFNKSISHNSITLLLKKNIKFKASKWDPAFAFSGYECLLKNLSPNIYRTAQKVKQYPQVCHGQSVSGVNVSDMYCSNHFLYTFPWDIFNKNKTKKTFIGSCF